MKQTILKRTLEGTESELYAVKGSRRYFFSKCKVNIELYEERFDIPACKGVKARKISIVITDDIDNRDIDSVSRFEIKTLVQRLDGIS